MHRTENTSWAVLLCRFNDDLSEPFPRNFYERMFTRAGAGSQNLPEFFNDMSHGHLDLNGSEVFGWLDLNRPRSDYTGSGANQAGRQELITWAKQAATNAGVDLNRFYGVVVCMNVLTDLFGSAARYAVCDNNPVFTHPSILGQEMGHGYGLDHSRRNGAEVDYTDPWDVMSTLNSCHMAPHPEYHRIGPGLNAWNMRGRGWLDEARVWKGLGDGYSAVTVQLRPLHRRDLPGLLAAEVTHGGERYLIEFRVNENWDAAIPRPAVLVHRFEANRSYIMLGTSGQHDLVAGDVFEIGVRPIPNFALGRSPYTRVAVQAIDPGARIATLRLEHQPGRREPRFIDILEVIFGVPIPDPPDGRRGTIVLDGRVLPVSVDDPMVRILEQIVLYKDSRLAAQPGGRDALQREALTAIAGQVEELMADVQPFSVPAPPSEEMEIGRAAEREARSE